MRYCDNDSAKEHVAAIIENADCTIMDKFQNPTRSEEKERTQLLAINGVCSRETIENFLDGGTTRRWTELVVQEMLCIPDIKPDIEQLISITSVVEFISQRTITAPSKTTNPKLLPPLFNQEGTAITGKKLIIEGVLRQKIVYSAVLTQCVHAVHFDMPFSAFIVLDPQDPLTRRFKVDACIEDIFVTDITRRKIFINVALIIRALPLAR